MWQRVAAAVAVEAKKRNIGEMEQSRFQFLPKLLVRSHMPDADLFGETQPLHAAMHAAEFLKGRLRAQSAFL